MYPAAVRECPPLQGMSMEIFTMKYSYFTEKKEFSWFWFGFLFCWGFFFFGSVLFWFLTKQFPQSISTTDNSFYIHF